MSSPFSKSDLESKTEENNFIDIFLREKDLAMQSLDFILEAEKFLEEKENDIIINKKNKKKIKDSALYDSNIIIMQTLSDEENEPTQIEREIEKLNKLLSEK